MSILIKGMEMPTAEQGVRTINIYADGVVTNYAEVTIGKAVPDPPHGRLIDADALVLPPKLNDWNSVAEYVENIADCWKAVDNATTIIPADMDKEET